MICLNGLKQKGFSILLCVSCFVVMSCKTIGLQGFGSGVTQQQTVLGTIGIDEGSLFKNSFKTGAIAKLNEPIRVSVVPIFFSKKTYNDFLESKTVQSADVNIVF